MTPSTGQYVCCRRRLESATNNQPEVARAGHSDEGGLDRVCWFAYHQGCWCRIVAQRTQLGLYLVEILLTRKDGPISQPLMVVSSTPDRVDQEIGQGRHAPLSLAA
jgi:hypothetical protein